MTLEQYEVFNEAVSWIERAEEKIHELRFNPKGVRKNTSEWQSKEIEGEIRDVCNDLNTMIYDFKSKHKLYNISLEDCSDYVKPLFTQIDNHA